jgi:hypothetical protein
MDAFVKHLKEHEDYATTCMIAFMSYNPSIGRVLEPGGVAKFQEVALRLVRSLRNIRSRDDFDRMHRRYVRYIMKRFRTSEGKKLSYGQAQKPLNVFLKVYVDRSRKPSPSISRPLRPYLHVPLDSIMMKTIKAEYPEDYQKKIRPYLADQRQHFSLSKVDGRLYWKWQMLFREKYPAKPVLFDVAWALNCSS